MKTASLETLSALLFGGERFLRRPPRPRPVSMAAVLYSFLSSLAMTETITKVDFNTVKEEERD